MDIALEKKPSSPPTAQRSRHVHDITDRFSMANTYIIDDGHLIVVDPGSVLNARLTLEYIQRFMHRSPTEIDLIVLTHLHPDHTSGVDILRRASQAPIAASVVAHHLLQKWRGEELHLDVTELANINTIYGHALTQRTSPGILHHLDLFSPNYLRQTQLVDLWLDDVGGLPSHPDWRVIASSGHTPESLCLYNPFSFELLCGDTIATIEGGSTLIRGSSNRRKLEETLVTLRNLTIHYLYPGHGRPVLSYKALANTHFEW